MSKPGRNRAVDRELLEYGKRFHGHLGPFLVIGLSMGALARERLGNPDPLHSMEALVELENRRPISCVIDGIQVSSGCTFGKGNISIRDGKNIKAVFRSKGRELKITVKEEIIGRISGMLKEISGEEASERVMEMPDEELLEVEYVKH